MSNWAPGFGPLMIPDHHWVLDAAIPTMGWNTGGPNRHFVGYGYIAVRTEPEEDGSYRFTAAGPGPSVTGSVKKQQTSDCGTYSITAVRHEASVTERKKQKNKKIKVVTELIDPKVVAVKDKRWAGNGSGTHTRGQLLRHNDEGCTTSVRKCGSN